MEAPAPPREDAGITREEIGAKLKRLGELRQREKELDAAQKAAIVVAAGRHATDIMQTETEIEEIEEELKAWAKVNLSEVHKTERFATGKITLAKNPPKVKFSKAKEDTIVAELLVNAPGLLRTKQVISHAAILAASASDDRGLITLAELAGITVVRDSTVKITC